MIKQSLEDIYQTIQMSRRDQFDIRTVTMGINLLPCISESKKTLCTQVEKRITTYAQHLKQYSDEAEAQYGIPIINKRITVTPASLLLGPLMSENNEKNKEICVDYAQTLDTVAAKLGIDLIGGYGAFTEMQETQTDRAVLEALPNALTATQRVCSFVNLGSTRHGINMETVKRMGRIITDLSTQSDKSFACARLVVFTNAVADNPFMAGGFHGIQGADVLIHIGLSGPGVVRNVIQSLPANMPLDELANEIKKQTFKLVRAGEVIGRYVSTHLDIPFGSVDLSLAPTTQVGDSVGEILELMGIGRVGGHGCTAALALLTDAVKKGGIAASAHVGGLSGAFIPVSEDTFFSQAVQENILTLDKLEAMTAVCSVGLDMVALPGDTSPQTLSAIIADEMAIGMVNHKTTAVRLIPVAGKKAGEYIDWGGLFGGAYIIDVHTNKPDQFIHRGGKIPAPLTSFRN